MADISASNSGEAMLPNAMNSQCVFILYVGHTHDDYEMMCVRVCVNSPGSFCRRQSRHSGGPLPCLRVCVCVGVPLGNPIRAAGRVSPESVMHAELHSPPPAGAGWFGGGIVCEMLHGLLFAAGCWACRSKHMHTYYKDMHPYMADKQSSCRRVPCTLQLQPKKGFFFLFRDGPLTHTHAPTQLTEAVMFFVHLNLSLIIGNFPILQTIHQSASAKTTPRQQTTKKDTNNKETNQNNKNSNNKIQATQKKTTDIYI